MKRTIIATTPFGTFTRQTDRIYSHIVAAEGARRPLAWCGSQRLAEAQLRYWQSRYQREHHFANIQIFPTDNGGVR